MSRWSGGLRRGGRGFGWVVLSVVEEEKRERGKVEGCRVGLRLRLRWMEVWKKEEVREF
jgi:hypothetical protein